VCYSVNLPGGVHFVALDNVTQNGFGRAQLDWLAADLKVAKNDESTRHIWIGMHKPPARTGVGSHSMDSDGTQAIADSDEAVKLFVDHRVGLILSSHSIAIKHSR